ncbi:carbohydrate ABC transporter permease [Microbispora hainanensis]|uniref:Carbohydrate ABC transporter permease n=1 Tax=Microbispora hainanensis TaxID=568844 RepID=A0ABZ1SFE5_9ACTN|nr:MULTISPECIES: carbohydrate ABC transporter permease [Microbispora]NJP26867.1 carbohydrate ABC transporter permease [Microbispora sp. CL1-1]TQS11787.1 carbohydrate ABC transporter permease [Microbispora sp. SCL1-1]
MLRSLRARPLTYLTLVAVAFFSAFPVYWSVVVASHDNAALAEVPPPLLPGGNFFANVRRVFDTAPFALALLNSFVVAGTITVSVMFFSTLAGFAFAKLRFRGRNMLLLMTVVTMMVPAQLGIIPLYMLMIKLEWTGTMYAVIVPALVNAFGVFFMTQYLSRALPTELLEAGRIDGCSTARLFWHVVIPAARPAAAVLGMLTFMTAWNDYFWPLVVLTPDNPTVQVALSQLASGYVRDFTLGLTGTAVATLPLVLVFVLLGKQIIGGIMQGAVKG